MFQTFVLLAAVACALGSAIQPRAPLPDGRIVGGEDASIEMFPYQVLVRKNGDPICGGCIIKLNVILTAAHCTSGSANAYTIKFGQTKLSTGGSSSIVQASRIIQHASYNSNTMDYDVALIILQKDLPNTATSKPINLANETFAPGTQAIVTGWGITKEGGLFLSNTLQKVVVKIVARQTCTYQYNNFNITDRMLCAGTPDGGKDACQGDSGGPLAVNNTLVGVVSWGVGCGRRNYPGVYANVPNLRTWIESNW